MKLDLRGIERRITKLSGDNLPLVRIQECFGMSRKAIDAEIAEDHDRGVTVHDFTRGGYAQLQQEN